MYNTDSATHTPHTVWDENESKEGCVLNILAEEGRCCRSSSSRISQVNNAKRDIRVCRKVESGRGAVCKPSVLRGMNSNDLSSVKRK